MTVLARLDVPLLALEHPVFGEDPIHHFAEARAEYPWLARSNIGFLVHECTALREPPGQDDNFRLAYEAIVDQLGKAGTP